MDGAVLRHAGVLLQAISWFMTTTEADSALYHLLKRYAASNDTASLQLVLIQPATRARLPFLLDSSRRSVLFYASSSTAAQLLLDSGCSLDQRDAYEQTPLHCAVIAGHVEVCRWMMLRRPRLVDVRDPGGKQAIHHAENEDMVRSVDTTHRHLGCWIHEQSGDARDSHVSCLASCSYAAWAKECCSRRAPTLTVRTRTA